MAFVVVYDACVLHPAPLRDYLLRAALTGVVRARWSARILDECFHSILDSRPDLNSESLARTRRLMEVAIPDAIIADFESIEPSLDLPDPNDRHVLAAAIRAGAQTIVTFNLDDFPPRTLERFDVEARHPDDFVLGLIDLAPAAMIRVLDEQAAALRNPPRSREELMDTLRTAGLVQSVARFRELSGSSFA